MLRSRLFADVHKTRWFLCGDATPIQHTLQTLRYKLFTDPDSRIMKRAGGGFDYSYNAQTAVNETAHIIVAVEVVNTNSDVQQLPMVLAAVKTHTGVGADTILTYLPTMD